MVNGKFGTTISRCQRNLYKRLEQLLIAQTNLGTTISRSKLHLHVALIPQLVAWRASAATTVKNVSWLAIPLTLSNCDSSHAGTIAFNMLQMPTQGLWLFGCTEESPLRTCILWIHCTQVWNRCGMPLDFWLLHYVVTGEGFLYRKWRHHIDFKNPGWQCQCWLCATGGCT